MKDLRKYIENKTGLELGNLVGAALLTLIIVLLVYVGLTIDFFPGETIPEEPRMGGELPEVQKEEETENSGNCLQMHTGMKIGLAVWCVWVVILVILKLTSE